MTFVSSKANLIYFHKLPIWFRHRFFKSKLICIMNSNHYFYFHFNTPEETQYSCYYETKILNYRKQIQYCKCKTEYQIGMTFLCVSLWWIIISVKWGKKVYLEENIIIYCFRYSFPKYISRSFKSRLYYVSKKVRWCPFWFLFNSYMFFFVRIWFCFISFSLLIK